MKKTIHTPEHKVFLRLLRGFRHDAKLSQEVLAARLDEPQTFISRVERGERRLDVIELRLWCRAMGVPIEDFVRALDDELTKIGK